MQNRGMGYWIWVFTMWTLCCTPVCAAVNQSGDGSFAHVDELLSELPRVAKEWNLDDPWFEKLMEPPSKQMVAALVEALRGNREFRERAVRRIAYLALLLCHAEQIPIGREQLILGLTESDRWVQAKCLIRSLRPRSKPV